MAGAAKQLRIHVRHVAVHGRFGGQRRRLVGFGYIDQVRHEELIAAVLGHEAAQALYRLRRPSAALHLGCKSGDFVLGERAGEIGVPSAK